MSINDRIKQIADFYGLTSYSSFAQKTGLSHQTASNYLKGKQKPDLEKLTAIKQSFENINTDWLLTGEGSMLRDAPSESPPVAQEPPCAELLAEARAEVARLHERLAECQGQVSRLIERL